MLGAEVFHKYNSPFHSDSQGPNLSADGHITASTTAAKRVRAVGALMPSLAA